MTRAEMESYQSIEADINLYWLPGLWFAHHLREAQLQGRITDAHGAKLIMEVFFLVWNIFHVASWIHFLMVIRNY